MNDDEDTPDAIDDDSQRAAWLAGYRVHWISNSFAGGHACTVETPTGETLPDEHCSEGDAWDAAADHMASRAD